MKLYENCIELSDKHVMWDMHNSNLNPTASDYAYTILVHECIREFSNIYGCWFYLYGRSGRHVCVEDNPKNRKAYCRMKRTIERQQKWLVKTFNSLKSFDDLDKHVEEHIKTTKNGEYDLVW